MSSRQRAIAQRRLKRDLIELQRANILSIAAHPIDNNIFEWHVNIKPTDGVYSGVYFHLIMVFPESYPTNPPTVKICTPIRHPNIFDSFLCLSMLRSHTGNVPYEGWSGAYSATSILMQLQSFLFAEKIDQDGGYQENAQLSDHDVNYSIKICKSFKCKKCPHSHTTPWPQVKGPPEALIKVFPTDPESGHVVVQGSACQTTHTYWVGAYGEFGCNYGRVFYEAFINWTGDKWRRDNIRGGLCRFGFGTEYAQVCGRSQESFGYGGTGMYSYANQFNKFGESFTKDDTITVAVDFEIGRIYFAKNGRLMEPNRVLYIPDYLQGALLYPILSFKNSRAEFNFGAAKRPCKWLIQQGFKTLEQVAMEQGTMDGEDDDDMKDIRMDGDGEYIVDWHNEYVIDELWLSIFECLQVPEVFSSQFVCKKWYKLMDKYNIMERNEIYCYYTKGKLGQRKGGKILGIGLSIKAKQSGFGFDIHSQMDILSLNAWTNGCKTGVWGERLTHFLPLVMNKRHAELAETAIKQYLQSIHKSLQTQQHRNKNELDKYIERNNDLQLVDTLITMMNQIVVQFVMGNQNADIKKVSMVMCEKVVLGYCALHHLLLYLCSKRSKSVIRDFANRKISYFINKENGCTKNMCKDLGKFLIYLMISSQYSWGDVAHTFVKEVFSRNVRWMVQEDKYKRYDTTKVVNGRLRDTFNASQISRRLVMFQVWFMQNNANETLQAYNQRLGRPRIQMRNGIVSKTKYILGSKSWWDYFNELGVIIKDENAIDQLLRFAVYNSKKNMYHRSYNNRLVIQRVNAPIIRVNGKEDNQKAPEFMPEGDQIGLKSSGRGRGWGNQNVRGSAWRGRGRGGITMVQRGRGRGRGNQNGNGNQNVNRAGPGGPGFGGRGRGFGNNTNTNTSTPGGGQQNQNQNQYQNNNYNPGQYQNNNNNYNPGQYQNQNQNHNRNNNYNQNQNQNQRQYVSPVRPSPRAPQQIGNYQHVPQHMQNILNNNNNNFNNNNNYNNQWQPGVQSEPGSANANESNELPQRGSKSQRRKRRRNKNKGNNGNNGNK